MGKGYPNLDLPPTWRIMGTYDPKKSTSNLHRGLRGLIGTVTIGEISTLNLQVWIKASVYGTASIHPAMLTGERP